ncbi:MAG: hypothetical protein ACD_66C00239G0003 [uncultured bacterium]|uniref:DUF5673 domain-containing protein n=1 Tax=Candidatus Uhrbacteria bacterium GW2011_GWC1_41_20 TaxID=1618983 RepID=A0A0G0VB73_9BACT|nr:MAG: hypothetical protein ACD_66C00239G0003 [uncultured bacterium]KKR21224.1 MAG: hypothetical protein UT52_C0031G0003 [Candidatus Uhrbacteria bacterium GW2011_GWE1_39_46]KKR89464.1 MAG: hypothetical protein UU40_C0025G0003 [Candidatus Uhrbacteria bacterium GW2011_GWD2_41_121]KKR95522.1 MAG: hypothetical protein UU46_C0022G0012 [Candidatus Uhrbacteria bacterium GW2011_GWD1_41_16]KKR98134.1 MAG: hypothetical protein UU50_C0021G0012 [Candidatus Uhrbacteria bacterium GW2011_GWC1_41_20]KKS05321
MPNQQETREYIEQDDELIDVGNALVSWETWEYQHHERSRTWYLIVGVIAAALLVYSIAIANYLFAIIVLMTGVIMLINGMRQPKREQVHITDMGIVVGDSFYDYKMIKDFALVYEPPIVKVLYVDFNSTLRPVISLQLEDTDPNLIRESLLPYVFENLDREDEALTDMLRRLYKL